MKENPHKDMELHSIWLTKEEREMIFKRFEGDDGGENYLIIAELIKNAWWRGDFK